MMGKKGKWEAKKYFCSKYFGKAIMKAIKKKLIDTSLNFLFVCRFLTIVVRIYPF